MSLKYMHHMAVINELLKGNLTVREAAWVCELSIRQVNRLRKKAREHGIESLQHGNCGRKSHRAVSDELRQYIVERYCSLYSSYSFAYFSELFLAQEGYKLSRSTIHRILLAAGISPAHKVRRKKKFRKIQKSSAFDGVKTNHSG